MHILLIDDDVNLSKVLAYQLKQEGYRVDTANSGREGLALFKKETYDVVLTDIQMPDISGIEVLNSIRALNERVIVILITAYGSVDSAVEASRMGADDYISKPFGKEQLRFTIEKAVRIKKLQEENQILRSELTDKFRFENMIAGSSAMQEVLRITKKVAASNATVLILGESGTGKELIARAIHYNSPRKNKPLITVNCPSIPDNLLESELFGHVKGAFTGALKDRVGKFEMANGGTIFLDEIGDLHEDLQAKLLRVLQEREIERVGDSKPIKIDVRIISATNQNLIERVKQKKFREDLYYRLSVIPIQLPPLRERKEDIPFLIDFFIQRYGGNRNFRLDADVIRVLRQYDWPGNVRELENVIERMTTLASGDTITLRDVPTYILSKESKADAFFVKIPEQGLSLETIEKQVILEVLKRSKGNQSMAARLLKIPRHVLLYRLKKYGLA